MALKHILILTLLVIALISCKSKDDTSDHITKILNIELDSLLSYSEIDAVSVGVYVDGKTYTLHKGELTVGLNNQPTDETLYEVASLTKTFTGTLLAQAIVEDKVGLDDDIRTVLEGDFPNLEYEGNPITFRHLVTHRSGLPFMFPNKPEVFEIADRYKMLHALRELEESLTKEIFFEELRKTTIDTLPGTKFGYSGAGANLLGYCLESIYNKSYEEILKEKIWSPLKMDHTKITVLATDNLTQGYNENHKAMPFLVKQDINAGGGIKSTVSDMMKYAIYHLDQNNEIIKKSHQKILGLWDSFDNGMFWQMFLFKDKPNKIFQNGGAFGTSCWMTLIPDNQIAVFIITNQAGQETHGRLDNAADKIIEKLATTKYKNN